MALKPDIPLKDGTFTAFKAAVEASRAETRKMSRLWKKNTDKTFGELPKGYDDDSVLTNKDYPRARQLQSQLFFRVPEVQSKPRRPSGMEVAPLVSAAINQRLRDMQVSHTIDEVLTDVIVSAGIGAVMVDYEAILTSVETKPVEHRETPDVIFAGLVETGAAEFEKVQVPTYEAYVMRRIAPDCLLYPVDFDSSNWDNGPWIGELFTIAEPEAKRQYKLTKDECEAAAGTKRESLTGEEEPEASYKKLTGVRLYYRRCFYDETAQHKDQIRELVYFTGMDKPVVHKDYHAQRLEGSQIAGVRRYPIRPLTKLFVPGRPVPPSDVTITRPQVAETEKARTLMMLQRERSLPIRWLDVNQVDEETEQLLMEGRVQTFVPMNGPGGNAIGEIARATYPRESFEFDRVINREIDECWALDSLGQPQSGETTAAEVKEMAQASSTRLDYDRSKVLRWFIECTEVLFGLMQLYDDQVDYTELIGPEGATQLVAWNKQNLAGYWALEARPDSALRLDAASDRAEALNLYQLLRRDELVDARGLLEEVVRTHNMLPSKTLVQQPPEPQPDRPNISFRFSGEDLDPTRPSALMVYDILAKSGMALDPTIVQAAREQAARTLALAAQNPAMGLADSMRLDIRGDAGQMPGTGATPAPPQPQHGGLAQQMEPLSKTQLTDARVK
jgi:hypothetical protein